MRAASVKAVLTGLTADVSEEKKPVERGEHEILEEGQHRKKTDSCCLHSERAMHTGAEQVPERKNAKVRGPGYIGPNGKPTIAAELHAFSLRFKASRAEEHRVGLVKSHFSLLVPRVGLRR
jgi:hypothetical protein